MSIDVLPWDQRVWGVSLADPNYRGAVLQRIKAHVVLTETGCWEWQQYRDEEGYGRVSLMRRMTTTHQVTLSIARGGVWSADYQVDHLCRVRACCNPEHLELVSQAENSRRGLGGAIAGIRQRRKTHCPQNHPYDEANTYVDRQGHRSCRRCAADAAHRRWCGRTRLEHGSRP